MNARKLVWLVPLAALASTGCSHHGAAASASSSGSGASAPKPQMDCPSTPHVAGCSVAIAPSADDYRTIETALGEAKSGDTVCLCPGTFNVDREVDIATPNLTLRGAGAAITDSIVDFSAEMGSESFSATGAPFAMSNLWIKNAPGDAVKVTGVAGVKLTDLKVSWDRGPSSQNGGYALYPVDCTDVDIERVEASDAADAAIYVGSSTKAVVKDCLVHDAVAGIESENVTDMDVLDNDVHDNAAGILVFALPGKTKKDALRTHVRGNHLHANNRANFGDPNHTIGKLPIGIGVLIIAASNGEYDGNTIEHQNTGGVVMVSGQVLQIVDHAEKYDEGTNPYPLHNYIHDNTFSDIGAKPDPVIESAVCTSPQSIEDVLWDGIEMPPGSNGLCLGTKNVPTFRSANGLANFCSPANESTDPTPFECDSPSLPLLTF